jgi:dolichol kinase
LSMDHLLAALAAPAAASRAHGVLFIAALGCAAGSVFAARGAHFRPLLAVCATVFFIWALFQTSHFGPAVFGLLFAVFAGVSSWCALWALSWSGLHIAAAELAVLVQAVVCALTNGCQVVFNLSVSRMYAGADAADAALVVGVLLAGSTVATLAVLPLVREGGRKLAAVGSGSAVPSPNWLGVAALAALLLVLACEYAAFAALLPSEPLTWVLSLIIDQVQWFCWLLAVTACTLVGIFLSGYEAAAHNAQTPGMAACADADAVSLKVAPSPAASGRAISVRQRPAAKPEPPQQTPDEVASVGPTVLVAAPTALSSSSGPAAPASTAWTPARRNLVVRKAFHAVALALFAPPVLLGGAGGLAFMQVASAGALHIALLLELARAARAPPAALCRVVEAAMRPFVDERDAGPLILTHLYLIAGCGLPLWLAAPRAAVTASASAAAGLSAGGAAAGGGVPWVAAWLLVLPLTGVIAAMGDAAAATCGIYASVKGHAVAWGALLRLRTPLASHGRKDVSHEGQGSVSLAGNGVDAAPRVTRRSSTSSNSNHARIQSPPSAQSADTTDSAPTALAASLSLWGLVDMPLLRRTLQRKTLQGTGGFAVLAWLLSVGAAAVAGLHLGLPLAAVLQPTALLGAAACAVVAALVETATVGVDNLLLPLVYWLLLDTALQRWLLPS